MYSEGSPAYWSKIQVLGSMEDHRSGREKAGTENRGVASCGGGGSWGAREPPPLVGLLLNKQPTIFRWRKHHGNILAVKAIVEKLTFLKFVFL